MKHTPGSWKLGKHGGTIVADSRTTEKPNTGHDDVENYGGYLICESIATQAIAQAITGLPDLLEACKMVIAKLRGQHLGTEIGLETIEKIQAAIAKAEAGGGLRSTRNQKKRSIKKTVGR